MKDTYLVDWDIITEGMIPIDEDSVLRADLPFDVVLTIEKLGAGAGYNVTMDFGDDAYELIHCRTASEAVVAAWTAGAFGSQLTWRKLRENRETA